MNHLQSQLVRVFLCEKERPTTSLLFDCSPNGFIFFDLDAVYPCFSGNLLSTFSFATERKEV